MSSEIPLAEKMRPTCFEDYIGQKHLVGQDAVLKKVVESGHIPSMIFWGPPGVGKTTLAYLIAKKVDYSFFTISAVHSGVKKSEQLLMRLQRKKAKAFYLLMRFIDLTRHNKIHFSAQ